MSKDKKTTGTSIEETIKGLQKKFGDDVVMKLDQKPQVGLESIPTGSFGLNMAIGIGGFPKGRIIEIYGPESSGKTTLALHTVAEAQKMGGICAYIDAEHAMDPLYAERLGVKTNELLICQPGSGEEGLEVLESMVLTKQFAVLVVDSVATLTPKAEIEGDMGDQHVGRQARLMSHALRKLVAIVGESNTIVIFINQLRQSIGGLPFTNPEFTPGGKALKFYSSVRLDIRVIAKIKKGDEVMGSRVRVKVVKNKCAPPFRQTEFDLMYNEGISKEGEILALGEKHKVIQKSGTSYKYNNETLGRGYDASRIYLKEHPEIAEEIIKGITDSIAIKVEMSDAEVTTSEE